MASMFDDLLAIKRFRESQAELAVSKQRQVLVDAEHAQEEAIRLLAEYRDWSERREHEMYDDLCSRIVRVREIENVLQGVAELRSGERRHEEDVQSAEKQTEIETHNLAERRESHQVATRMTEKFIELARLHLAAFMLEQERKEDLEMEEAASVRRDREDWEEHEEYEPS